MPVPPERPGAKKGKMFDLNSIVIFFLRFITRFTFVFTMLYFHIGDFINIVKGLELYLGISLDSSRDHEGKGFDMRVSISIILCLIFAQGVKYLVHLQSERLGFGNSTGEPSPTAPWDFENSRIAYKPLNPLKREIRLLHLPQRNGNQSMLSSTAFTDTINHLMYPN